MSILKSGVAEIMSARRLVAVMIKEINDQTSCVVVVDVLIWKERNIVEISRWKQEGYWPQIRVNL